MGNGGFLSSRSSNLISLLYLSLSLSDVPEVQCVQMCFGEAVARSSHTTVVLRAGFLSLCPEDQRF